MTFQNIHFGELAPGEREGRWIEGPADFLILAIADSAEGEDGDAETFSIEADGYASIELSHGGELAFSWDSGEGHLFVRNDTERRLSHVAVFAIGQADRG